MPFFSRKKYPEAPSAASSTSPSESALTSRLASESSELIRRWSAHVPPGPPSAFHQWTSHAPSGPPSALHRCSHTLSTSATAAGELFLFGGYAPSSESRCATNDLYVISTQNFSTTLLESCGDIPSPRLGHRAVFTRPSILLVWGGTNTYGDQVDDDSLYLFNLVWREWTCIVVNGPGPGSRYNHSMTLIGSKLFIFGGKFRDECFNDIWAMDLNCLRSNPFWELYEPAPGNEKPHPRDNHVSVTSGDRIIIFGGYGSKDTLFNDTWSFNISTRKWTELECTGSIPSPRTGHTAVLIDDLMYVFGGFGGGQMYLNDLTVFNLSTQRWTACQDIEQSPSKRTCHAMARDGTRVFVLGGYLPLEVQVVEKPIHVLETKHLDYPGSDSDVINSSEKIALFVQNSSASPSTRGQPYQLSSSSDAHAAYQASPFQKELDHPTFQHVTREQNPSLNNLPSRPTGASGRPRRRILQDSEDSTEHNAKLVAPSGRETLWSENKRLIELEQQLSEMLVAQTERDQRIGQLTDELAQATEEKKRAGQEKRELQMKLDESLLSRDMAETNTAEEKKRAELEKGELQVKLNELQARLDESLLSRNHTVNQVEASAAEEKRRATLELREFQVKFDRLLLSGDRAKADAEEAKKHAGLEQRELQLKLDRLMLSRDQAEADAVEVKRRAGLEQRESQVKLNELILSRDEHLRMLEQAQISLQEATSRAADADERACEHEAKVAELRAELEGKKSELTAIRFRLMDAKDGWAKGNAKADKSHTVTAANLIDSNEVVCELGSLKWNEKSIEEMKCGNEG